MKVNAQHYRSIWADTELRSVNIIDQSQLPFTFSVVNIASLTQMIAAINQMQVRGAPLIGVAAAYGMALATTEGCSDQHLQISAKRLKNSRPTAVNLAWAVDGLLAHLMQLPDTARSLAAWQMAAAMADADIAQNRAIGSYGLTLLQALPQVRPIQILTHCNAGWLATVDIGTALAPVYAAHDAGIALHVWVDETRPRNQGASLTAWELAQHGVPYTVIADNTGGHLMQQGLVDVVIVGADRVTSQGDVCNKIGTYLKALAAYDNGVPFYAAVPSPTIDWQIASHAIAIENRHTDELAYITGSTASGLQTVRILAENTPVLNPAFDITPARLVNGIITEHGIFSPATLTDLKSKDA